jgi:hypothetical protein
VIGAIVDLQGGFRHVLGIAALVAVFFMAPSVGPAIGQLIGGQWLGLSVAAAGLLGTLVFATLIVGGVTIFAGGWRRRLRRNRHFRGLDHIAGGLLGAGEGAALVAAGCWLLTSFAEPLELLQQRLYVVGSSSPVMRQVAHGLGQLSTSVRNDRTGQWLAAHNPLERMPIVQAGHMAVDFAADPSRVFEALESGKLAELAELPEVKRHLAAFEQDAALQRALEERDVDAILSNRTVRAMLDDDDLQRAILDHRGEIRAALGPVDYERLQREARQLSPGQQREVRQFAERYRHEAP